MSHMPKIFLASTLVLGLGAVSMEGAFAAEDAARPVHGDRDRVGEAKRLRDEIASRLHGNYTSFGGSGAGSNLGSGGAGGGSSGFGSGFGSGGLGVSGGSGGGGGSGGATTPSGQP